MQPITNSLQPLTYAPVTTPVFKTFAAYEDSHAWERARRVCNQIELVCGNEVQVLGYSLGFESFHQEALWKRAVADAATADVIILSASGANELPPAVMSWIQTWPTREPAGQDALVLVFDPDLLPCDARRRTSLQAQKLAEQRGFEFFCNLGSENGGLFLPPSLVPQNWERSRAWATAASHQAMENWGIND